MKRIVVDDGDAEVVELSKEDYTKAIEELITRRRRQVLIHSIIYYRMNENIVSDDTWAAWALELEDLQNKYPEIADRCPYAEGFKNFDHSTGMNLPLDDSWAIGKATQLLGWRNAR